jgi:hypothetical protein
MLLDRRCIFDMHTSPTFRSNLKVFRSLLSYCLPISKFKKKTLLFTILKVVFFLFCESKKIFSIEKTCHIIFLCPLVMKLASYKPFFCMLTFFLFLMSSCTSEISPQNLQDGRHRIANYIRTRGMKARNSLSKEKTIL